MSTNPFDDRRSSAQVPAPSTRSVSRGRRRTEGEPPIWAARNVEWPIPASLSLSNYQKLLRASKQTGTQLGIVSSALDASLDHKDGGDGEGGGSASDSQNYYGLSGFMSRVLNTSGATSEKTDDDILLDQDVVVDSKRGSKPLRPPRNGCVATANGWIVAALECPSPTGALPLRLVSRWNVRRGSSADQWTALPPPVGGDGRIVRVFVDPTGCHTFLSARNGEAYYLHSSSRVTQKLSGFGKNPDGNLPKDLTGVAATSVVRSNNDAAHVASIVQEGLTAGSFVTAVAWDRERGTEGSTKKIILGTSLGELYEYSLLSPNSEGTDTSVQFPILLHKLHLNENDPSEAAAAVTGIFFERWRVGMLILVATSGRHKRTRFHTFYSPSDTPFRLVLANQQHASLVELPGSVDFADLRLCNDNFALRTETGIYYGTFDRSQTGAALLSAGSGVINESGILPYETGKHSSSSSSIPVSVALTPHHLITLYESNEVRFINRVAQKVIQKEKVDWISATPGASLDESAMGLGELLTDIRRPEQVWLRKSRALIHISSSQEDRDVWKYTLEKCLAAPSKPSAVTTQLTSTLVSSLSGPVPVLTEEEKAQEALFEHAKSLCTNAVQKCVVTAVRAEYHLSQGRAELAAKYLAQCPAVLEPFADTSIRLALPMLGIDDPTSYGGSPKAKKSLAGSNLPLITYLSDKMRVGRMNDDNVTCTMIGAWLTELHLHGRERTALGGRGAKTLERSQQALLAQLLTNHVNSMDSKTIMRILSSHDVNAYECASYASASGDIGTAVNAALSLGAANTSGALEALRILNSSPFEIAEPLYYKHAPTFLERAPIAAAQSFLSKYGQGLSPTKLLPSFMHYEHLRTEKTRVRDAVRAGQSMISGGVEETKVMNDLDDIRIDGSKSYSDGVEMHLRPGSSQTGFIDDPAASSSYFEGVVKMGCRSSAVFSYLISLYVKMTDEEPLFRFLTTHVPAAASVEESIRKAILVGDGSRIKGDDMSFPLDLSYALRSVLNSGRHFRSAVKLYTALGMLQQAVELALKVDPSLARELAQESVEVDERRRLWLMIARNAATDSFNRGGSDVVSKVVSVLKDCGPDVLSIEDVLPFLPDFTQIDQIKDEICSALMSYASKIEGYLKEMNECDQTCDALREEIMRLSTHRMEMKSDARCALTKKFVLSAKEPFYVFPSGYVILESALKAEVLPHLNAKQRARVKAIELLLKQQKDAESRELLQAELDGLIAAECPLTGVVAVENIDRGFDGTEFDDTLLHRRGANAITGTADRTKMKANV